MPTPVVVRPPTKPPKETRHRTKTRDGVSNLHEDKDGKIKATESASPLDLSSRSIIDASSTDNHRDTTKQKLSQNDISASPRLTDYFICFTASVVCLVSVMVYEDRPEKVQNAMHAFVKDWKVTGALVAGAGGTGLTGAIMIVHFDKICFPDLWRRIFGDGSKGELAVITILLLFWTVGVYLCTSPFSVGEVAVNIYFSSWFAFASSLRLFARWRHDAGYRTAREYLINHPSKTAYYWAWLTIFAIIIFVSAVELFARRNTDDRYLGIGSLSKVALSTWIEWMSVSGSLLFLSLLGIFHNFYWSEPSSFKVSICSCTMLWGKFEGFLLLAIIGINCYGLVKYTGTQGFINTPSNPYFSIYGLYFSSVTAFSAWLRGNDSLVVFRRNK